MKLKNKLLITLMCATAFIFGQSPLPTSYDFTGFNGTIPQTGWTTTITGTYTYAVGKAGVAGKLDAIGEYVQIYYSGPAGSVAFYLKGWVGTGVTAFIGTFTVEESQDGINWTTLSTQTSLNISSYQLVTLTPASLSRYLRFIFTNKNTGNVGIDEIAVTPLISAQQEINLKQAGTTILNGGMAALFNSPVSTTTPLTFNIENLGTSGSLTITSTIFSGVDAADFSISSAPTVVNPSSTASLIINFTPSASGTRTASLIINNDDSDESAYTILLTGIGGNYATEPSAQPTVATSSNLKSYRYSLTFNASVPAADGYIVLRKTGSTPIADVPVDGTVYTRGDNIGTSKVVYTGTAGTVTPANVIANTIYQYAIYSYNGSGSFINYLNVSPLTGSITTPGSMMPANEYLSISTVSPNFLADLSAQVNPHVSIIYGDYDETMVRLFTERDTVAGQRVLTCVYSGENYIYTPPLAWGYFSREHSYCHNWMPTFPADATFPELPEYNDQHHLFPTNQTDANSERSNYPLGEVVTLQGQYLKAKWGLNAKGQKVFEPRDEQKGDVARAIMYMCVTYNGINGKNWKLRNPISGTIAYGQDQNLLRKWHYQDPPDNWEISRNDFLDSLQGNRNPFIDSVQYACYIDFSTMTKIANATIPCNSTTTSVKEYMDAEAVFVYPNPATNNLFITILVNQPAIATISLKDMLGRAVYQETLQLSSANTPNKINLPQLAKGIYVIEIKGEMLSHSEKIVIE